MNRSSFKVLVEDHPALWSIVIILISVFVNRTADVLLKPTAPVINVIVPDKKGEQ